MIFLLCGLKGYPRPMQASPVQVALTGIRLKCAIKIQAQNLRYKPYN